MRQHHYKVTLEALDGDNPGQSLSFTGQSHDEIIGLLARIGCREGLTQDETAAMLVGLKLLGEVAMTHRKTPPFDALQPAPAGLHHGAQGQGPPPEGGGGINPAAGPPSFPKTKKAPMAPS